MTMNEPIIFHMRNVWQNQRGIDTRTLCGQLTTLHDIPYGMLITAWVDSPSGQAYEICEACKAEFRVLAGAESRVRNGQV